MSRLIININSVFAPALIIILVLLSGCMETNSPSNQNNYNLTVLVYQVNTVNPLTKIAIRGADVSIFEPNQNTALNNSFTNSQGAAVFQLTVPLIGSSFSVFAEYNGVRKGKSAVLICRDTAVVFLFDTTTVTTVDCGNLNGNSGLIFTDETGSRLLKQNTPKNVNRYDNCWTMTNPLSNPNTITATLPTVNDPFRLESISLDGNLIPLGTQRVDIPSGSSLTLCFSVSTVNTGQFSRALAIQLSCGNQSSGTQTLNLDATVIEPQCDCDITQSSFTMLINEKVQVGQTRDISNVVYTNNAPCPITIDRVSFDGNDGWQVLSPTFPVILQQNESLTINARFTANKALTNIDTLRLRITPQGASQPCDFDVYLEGDGCSNSCPLVSTNNLLFRVMGNPVINDILSNRSDNRVFVSGINGINSVNMFFYFKNPDSACTDVTITFRTNFSENFSPRYFNVSPQSLTLTPGETGSIQVTFEAPTIDELKAIVTARGGPAGRTSDSTFRVQITAQTQSCSQVINDSAIVTAFPDISPIINLRAYQQVINQVGPDNEVYIFGNSARTINKPTGGGNGPYPPDIGDIWIDIPVNNNGPAPQNPTLLSRNNIGMKIWRSGFPESSFSDVQNVFSTFSTDPAHSTGYSTNPITPVNVRDVIAFQFSATEYALVYIRRVDVGSENTSTKQSGIEFRSIYPIYVP